MEAPLLHEGPASWSDDRGWGLRLVEAGVPLERVREAHAVSVTTGSVRGNHRHPASTEWLLALGGPFTVAWRGPDGRRGERRTAEAGGATLFAFEPGVAHAVRWDGPGEGLLLSLSDEREPVTERVDPLL